MNARIFLFALVALALIAFPAYVFIDEKLSGGIKPHGDVLQVNLKAMSTFDFDQQDGKLQDVPQKWRDLDGKRIEVEGEMYQPAEAGGRIAAFDLVYSIANCCFTSAPQIQHFVKARVKDGAEVDMYSGLVRVVGTLHVKVVKSEGKIVQVYALEVESVKKV